jgi:hypothetical protein
LAGWSQITSKIRLQAYKNEQNIVVESANSDGGLSDCQIAKSPTNTFAKLPNHPQIRLQALKNIQKNCSGIS